MNVQENMGFALPNHHQDSWHSVVDPNKPCSPSARGPPWNLSDLHPQTLLSFMEHMVCTDGSQPYKDFSTWLGGPGSLAVPQQ